MRMPARPLPLAAAPLVAVVVASLTFSALALPAIAAGQQSRLTGEDLASLSLLGDSPQGLAEVDEVGRSLPTTAQRTAARALGADVRWNDLGSPASVLPHDGSLGTAGGTPAQAARSWLRQHADVLGLTTAEVDDLEVVNVQELADSRARAVLLRQRYGGLAPALGGLVTVGVAPQGGSSSIAYVSSSLARGTSAPPTAVLTPRQGWLAAAQDLHAGVVDGDISGLTTSAGWTRMTVTGFAQPQLARTRALALADGTTRPVIEANVVDVAGADVAAYTVLVDAVDGDVLWRHNLVDQANDTSGFQGEITADQCGPMHPLPISDDATKQVLVTAAAVVGTNDIVLKLYGPDDALLTTSDTATSPESLTYQASGGGSLAQGTYGVQVCPFEEPTVPFVAPGLYGGTISLSESSTGTPGLPYPPMWRYFDANPTPRFETDHTPHNSVVGCWVTRVDGSRLDDCTEPTGRLESLASRSPWDVDPTTSLSTLTTLGNNVSDREAWASPLTPGGTFQAPVSPTRQYTTPFTDAWNNSGCDPANLVPGGNDIDFAVTNLFSSHNRMHDYAYFLGFTEANYNLQSDNFDRGGTDGDPEIGNVQAGALSGGQPSYLGRDNANQVTLQDGVPGITNQYLFQPIAGSFYAPCTDGDLDMGIVGHEYTHAISNRMIGGPDDSITSEQGGAMGEAWGDQVAAEYQFSHGYSNGGNVWAVGLYATGNKKTAIRDYAINHNPLTYGEYGFDSTGNEVHADGEIWNATQWRVRQALVKKYRSRYPYGDAGLQLRCSRGQGTASPLPANQCPGNRRWVQLVFDAFLLQQGATSMLDARDAMLAADTMRFGGKDRAVMWKAFARSGMGVDASTPNADSGNVEPSFATPSGGTAVRFQPVLTDGSRVKGRIYIGTYEARATPVADTVKGKKRDAVAVMAPGTYTGVVQSTSTGLHRFRITVPDRRKVTERIVLQRNLASSGNGGKITSSSPGSLNAASLIDSTESTNWAGVNDGTNVDADHPFVVVDLAGGVQTLRRAVVSAMLRPAPASPADVPLAADPDSGSRFTALRKFALDVCTTACNGDGATWTRAYTSPGDAFPSVRPRPTAPTLTFRTFTFPKVRARYVRLVALENQCTGFAGYAGEQDSDPLNDTDCKTASDRGQSVRAAELELFTR